MGSISRLKTELQKELGLSEWGERDFIPSSMDDEIIETNQQLGVGSIDASKIKNLTLDTLTIAATGYVNSGKTSFTDAAHNGWFFSADGIYIGSAGDVTKFLYKVSDGSLVITGAIAAATGTVGGFDVGVDYIRDSVNSFGLAATVTAGDDVRFWAGATFANRATAATWIKESGAAKFTSVELSGNVVISGLQAGSSIDAQYLAAASITGAQIANATITAANITNATITGAKIAAATITATNIAAATITATEIANATITATQIANATITGAKIANATITATNITAATITASEIANATITGAKIAAATIAGSNIAAATIAGSNIASGTITAANITAATITASEIANATITGAKIANATITGSNLVNATITGTQIASATIAAANIISGTITTTEIASGTITGTNIAASTITGSNLAAATITASKITALTITAAEIANLTINGTKIADSAISPAKTSVPIFIMTGTFTDNSPGAGFVAWTSAVVYYNGTAYTITNNNTSSKYVIWNSASPTVLSGTGSVPTTTTVWLVGLNLSGTFTKTWDMPQVHGEQIEAATITGTQIASATITATNITAGTITATEIATGTITATQIAAATITGAKIASGTITSDNITNATITGADIASGTITSSNIANATITTTQISATAGIAGSQLANNTITATQIANGTITTTQIGAAAGITGSQLANNTITASKIDNGTITATQINDSAGIVGTQLANNTITATQIQNATIGASQISNGAVTPVKTTSPLFVLSAGSFTNNSPIAGSVAWTSAKVTYNGTENTITNSNTAQPYIVWVSSNPTALAGSATVPTAAGSFLVGINASGTYSSVWDVAQVNGLSIQANTITAGQIANGTISTTQISGSAGITGSQIANNTISATNITNATITTTQISNTANITGTQIASNTITSDNITNATIVGGDIAAGTITGSNIANATIAAANIVNGTITATQITAATITANEIANLTITASQIANATITAGKLTVSQLSAITVDLGAITAGTIVLPSGGYIRSGQTAYDTGTGFYLGNDSSTPKFSIGNNAGNKLTWSGTTLGVTGAITASSIDGTSTINGTTALIVEDEATTDLSYGVFRGHQQDNLTIAQGNATVTRSLLTTQAFYATGGNWSLKSGTFGAIDTTGYIFDWTKDYQYFTRLLSDTGAATGGTFAGKSYYWGLAKSGADMSPQAASDLTHVKGRVLPSSHIGFIVDWDNKIFATSGSGLVSSLGASQDITDLSASVTHTNFNNYKIESHYATFPTISNTGFIRPTASSTSGGGWTNAANAYDTDTNTFATGPSNSVSQILFTWDGGTTYTQGQSTNATTSKSVITIGGQYNTFGRKWSVSEFSDANFFVAIAPNTANYSSSTPNRIMFKTFGFSTGTWIDVTGIEIEFTVDSNGDGSGPPYIYDVRAKIYFTTVANTGYVKFYVNDTLLATHTASIPRSTDNPVVCFSSSQGNNSASNRHVFYNNYRTKIL